MEIVLVYGMGIFAIIAFSAMAFAIPFAEMNPEAFYKDVPD